MSTAAINVFVNNENVFMCFYLIVVTPGVGITCSSDELARLIRLYHRAAAPTKYAFKMCCQSHSFRSSSSNSGSLEWLSQLEGVTACVGRGGVTNAFSISGLF